MLEATSTSRGGLELLDDNLVDPAVVARNLESMHRAEQWIKVRCGTLISLVLHSSEYLLTVLSSVGCR
jgi:hypothetical protein